MGIFKFVKRLIKRQEEVLPIVEVSKPPVETPPMKLPEEAPALVKESLTSEKEKPIFTKIDLIEMARQLKDSGEYYRAEQLLRDGVKDAQNSAEYWWLLIEVEEPLKRHGRAFYCVEQLLELDQENDVALQKFEELKPYIDKDLGLFIEYKLAPEFYKLK